MEVLRLESEAERLRVLRSYEILDTSPELAFDRVTSLAARLFQVPVVLISLLDEHRQWFKARYGLEACELSRRSAFCAHTIQSSEVMIVPDATQDPRFFDNPLVIGALAIRFYAGAPLLAPEGVILGSLCVIDTVPRSFSESEAATLRDLAAMVMDELSRHLGGLRLLAEIARREGIERELEARVEERSRQLLSTHGALQQAEAKYRSIVEEAVEGIFQTTPEGRFLSANPALARLCGYSSPEELILAIDDIGRQIYVDPTTRGRFIRGMCETGEVTCFEAEVYRRDGSRIWVAETARAVHDEAGHLRYYEGMVKNISVRKAGERELHEAKAMLETRVQERTAELQRSNAELRAEIAERRRVEAALHLAAAENNRLITAIQSSPAGLLISDPNLPDCPTIFVNQSFERITGYPPEEVLGRNCRFLQGPNSDPEIISQIRQSVAQRQIFCGMILNYRRDGTPFWNELTVSPVFDAEGRLANFVGLQNDVTDRVRAIEALRLAKEEAERANLAKSYFLSRMSHELRTPLNAILGFSQLLAMQRLDPLDAENVEFIGKAGRHLLDLINEVLDLARIEAGRVNLVPETVPVWEVVEEAISLIRPDLERQGLLLRLEKPAGEEFYVTADRQRFRQILLNLLSNAVKYNGPHGLLTVSCCRVENGQIGIGVSDTGAGLAAENLARLFIPFERLGAEYSKVEGTGIGLALSQRLAQLQGGEIAVESTVGQGSRFTLCMPAAPRPASPVAVEAQRQHSAARLVGERPLTVLYVEDNFANLQLMERIVAKHPGWRLLTAECAEDGWEVALDEVPDLILLDLHLPDLSGDLLLGRLRAESLLAATPVVIVSADAMSQQVRKLLAAGADAYLTKPIDVSAVLELLDRHSQTAQVLV